MEAALLGSRRVSREPGLARWSANETVVLSIGLLSYLVYLYFLLGNDERICEWTNSGKQRFELLDRYGGYIAFSIIVFALFLGPFVG